MSKLKDIKPKISIAHPMEDALAYIEQIIRYKEDWPIDRIMAIKKVMAELDIVMVELTNNTVNINVLKDNKEE
jgi:hypothetical protein